TTGNPKGVLYSHRSLAHVALLMSTVDGFGIGARDTIFVAVPLFHAAGWCMPYVAGVNGAKLVLPGPNLQPAEVIAAIDEERVTFSCGVPTLWSAVATVAEERRRGLEPLKRVICAGSAVPSVLIARYERLGVEMRQAWGMTEAPLGTLARVKQTSPASTPRERHAILEKQGIPVPTFEARIIDADAKEAPHDGTTSGELEIRGLTPDASYFADARHG